MNVNQQRKRMDLWQQVHTFYPGKHGMSESKSPVSVHVRCLCGWHYQATRHQNALARNSRIAGAINEHLTRLIDHYHKTRGT